MTTTPTLPRPSRQRKCVSKLRAGEYKRIPASRGGVPIVIYLACPSCRFISAIDPVRTRVEEKVDVVETPIDFVEVDVIASMGAFMCNRCRQSISIDDGAFRVAS